MLGNWKLSLNDDGLLLSQPQESYEIVDTRPRFYTFIYLTSLA